MIYYRSRHPIKVSHLTNSFCQSKHGYLVANSNYHYLKHLLDISVTCKFHTLHAYRQIPLLVNSTGLPLPPNSIACKFPQDDFTVKVHYMQIPRQPIYCQNPLLADSITCKFTQPKILHLLVHQQWWICPSVLYCLCCHQLMFFFTSAHCCRLFSSFFWSVC